MDKLPQHGFLEGFYIWFNKEKKEEYYATPLYLYNAYRKDVDKNNTQTIILEKNTLEYKPQKKVELPKHPAFISNCYVEKFGMMLIRFLNADLSSFETAYNDFFFAYGFEFLKESAIYQSLDTNYKSEIEFITMIKKLYEVYSYNLHEYQQKYREIVDTIYNLNGKSIVPSASALERFAAYMISNQNEIGSYSSKIEVFLDNYANRDNLLDYANKSIECIIDNIQNGKISINKIYKSMYLTNILYIISENVTQADNLPIKKCQICGKYFIPTTRQDEIYCDFPDENGKTCKEKGAMLTYRKALENTPALLEYRRSYQKKLMEASRNKDNKKLKQDFDKWKKTAQDKIKQFKKGELSEEKLYEWMVKNK